MKLFSKIILAALFLFLAFAASKPFVALGLDLKYTPPCLENVTGPNFKPCVQAPSAESITGYIANIYRFIIGISGILALGMIVAGAIYISVSPGSVDKQGEGKNMITSAIFGIVLIFGSYLILNTINPSLTILQEPSITPISTSTASNVSSTPNNASSCLTAPIPTYWTTNEQAVSELSAMGVGISSTDNCSDRCNTQCTSLLGIPKSVLSDLEFVIKHCKSASGGSCTVTVTGGTEIGHDAHGPGKSVVDLSFNTDLAKFFTKSSPEGSFFSLYNVVRVCTTPADAVYRKNCQTDEKKEHLHVEFNPVFDLYGQVP